MGQLDDVAAQLHRLTLGAAPSRAVSLAPWRRAVAAVDGSRASKDVLAWATSVFPQGRVDAVVVGPPRSAYDALARRGSEWAAVSHAWQQEADEAEQVAAATRGTLGDSGRAHVVHGDPTREIVTFAHKAHADLVVLGPHGDGPVARLLLGSVAEGVKDRVRASVLFARGTPPPRRILAATDGSPHSRRAVLRAVVLARAWNAELTVIHAHDLPRMGSAHAAQDTVRALLRDMGDARAGGILYRLVIGKPVKAILDQQKRVKADLVVVGRRGSGPLGGRLFGSVSGAVARRAPCAVLVVD